jgi:hypothetical protein
VTTVSPADSTSKSVVRESEIEREGIRNKHSLYLPPSPTSRGLLPGGVPPSLPGVLFPVTVTAPVEIKEEQEDESQSGGGGGDLLLNIS